MMPELLIVLLALRLKAGAISDEIVPELLIVLLPSRNMPNEEELCTEAPV